MFIEDDEKDDRKKALDSLRGMLDSGMGERLKGLKKPPMDDRIDPEEQEEAEDDFEGSDDGGMENVEEDNDENALSDSDKDRIKELYHKYF